MRRATWAVLLCGGAFLYGCAGASASGNTRTIAIEHSAFSTSSVQVEAGETVTFVVVNNDPIDHELIIGDAEVQKVHETGTEAHHGDEPGEISVPALSTAETTFTFGGPGRVFFACHLPGHLDFGMKGTIDVR